MVHDIVKPLVERPAYGHKLLSGGSQVEGLKQKLKLLVSNRVKKLTIMLSIKGTAIVL